MPKPCETAARKLPKRCFWNLLKTSACEKAEPQQVLCPSHCETAARKMRKRRFWNPLKRKKYSAQTMRNRSQKTAETLLLEPTKNKEKTCKLPGQTQEKGVWDAHAKKQNPSRFCAEAIAKPQPGKCETSLLEPTKKKRSIVPKPCETAAGKLPKRCFWNLLKTKKKGCERLRPARHSAT